VPLSGCEQLQQDALTEFLLNDLVGAGKQRGRDSEAERLCSLEVDDQLDFGRHLHRQICRFLTLENAINVPSSAAKLVN